MNQFPSLTLPWQLPRIGVVEVFGVLGTTIRGAEYGRMLAALRDDARIRAVVVDIDSPGGSASTSEHIHRAVAKVAARKPVIAFVRGAGLSGGYLVSCAATKIVAIPTAVVGSIGVISIRPVVAELLQRLGVKVFVTKSGAFKDMFQPFREPTDEEQGMLQSLVDELGDLDMAVDMATELGKVPRRLAYLRPRRPILERLLGRTAQTMVQEIASEVESRLYTRVEFRGP